MSKQTRVRFAPSPTGPLHIGGVRTALYNYLFAKNQGGKFILRIEDTDQSRYVEGAEDYIVEALNWCNIPFDEGPGKDGGFGPYRQSERTDLYRSHVQTLLDAGKAYYAFDTPETLDRHRKDHEAKGKTFIYNWHNRLKLDNSLALSPGETEEKLSGNTPYVVRFMSPESGTVTFHDLIRGEITVDAALLDDKILFKSDGMPTYHLANIVDDHLMEITHVIRGEEWLPSLALHHLLYDAFGWEPPEFAHLPLILKPTGKGKLSKRDGEAGGFPVFPLRWEGADGYREYGYYPEAVLNFLAMLGWNPGTDRELFSLDELTAAFTLDRVNKSGARFDPEKTVWYNQQYLQERSDAELLGDIKSHLGGKPLPASDEDVLRVIALMRERASFPLDILEKSHFFFTPPGRYAEKAVRKHWKEDTGRLIGEVAAILEATDDFRAEVLEASIKSWIKEKELGFGKVLAPLRLAVVGELKGPDLFAIIAFIGKEDVLARLHHAIKELSGER